MSPVRAWPLVLVMALGGCDDPYAEEGREPFECRDGADNDGDGYFDCQDNGCWGSPDCGGGGDDTGISDTGDTGGGDTSDTGGGDTSDTSDTGGGDTADTSDTSDTSSSGTDWSTLQTVRIEYSVVYDVTDDDQYCTSLAWACDCTLTYKGDGAYVESSGSRVTMYGAWYLDSIVPADEANPIEVCGIWTGGIWTDTTDESYHSFHFRDLQQELDVWVAHKFPSNYDPVTTGSPAASSQYNIWDMREPWNPTTKAVTYDEEAAGSIDGFIDLVATHHLELYFDEPPAR